MLKVMVGKFVFMPKPVIAGNKVLEHQVIRGGRRIWVMLGGKEVNGSQIVNICKRQGCLNPRVKGVLKSGVEVDEKISYDDLRAM